ncbi:MAG: type II toxin-antitoxin system VapC family toxin [Phycisphaerae bacterium]
MLDTAVFWWLATDSARLSKAALGAFADPANEISVSPISCWELLVKHQLGRLPVSAGFVDVLTQARAGWAIRSIPLKESAVMRLASLPGLHRDPFDRMLICQAIDEGMTILTPDDVIRAYPVATMW